MRLLDSRNGSKLNLCHCFGASPDLTGAFDGNDPNLAVCIQSNTRRQRRSLYTGKHSADRWRSRTSNLNTIAKTIDIPISSLRGASATKQSGDLSRSPRALQALAMTGRGLKTFYSREVSKNRRKNTPHSQPRASTRGLCLIFHQTPHPVRG